MSSEWAALGRATGSWAALLLVTSCGDPEGGTGAELVTPSALPSSPVTQTSAAPAALPPAVATDAPAATSAAPPAPPGAPVPFSLTSPAFTGSPECSSTSTSACAVIPAEHTSYMEGSNLSPELHWAGAPPGTQSFALTLVDVSYGQPLWAIWNIPGSASTLPPSLPRDSASLETPAGAQQSNATFAVGEGYWGPDTPCNVYEFELFALSTPTFMPSKAEYVALVRSELEGAEDSVLARTKLSARSNYMLACQ